MSREAIIAGHEYNLRKHKLARPKGRSDGVRWWPEPSEWCDCCKQIREPSRGFPLSLYRHCHTAVHVAQLYGVDEGELRAVAKRLEGLYVVMATDDPLMLINRDHASRAREAATRLLVASVGDVAEGKCDD